MLVLALSSHTHVVSPPVGISSEDFLSCSPTISKEGEDAFFWKALFA